jgi:hypothetical protein
MDVTIKTPDGTCDAYFVKPATGTGAGVLIWPDIFGLRPAFRTMGKRLAENGYAVLVVNPFYRVKPAPTAEQGAATPIPSLIPLAQALNATTHATDAKAFIAWLDQQPSVAKNRKIGTQGYCMGGPMAFRTAANSDRVGAVASFHGGGLVTADADSPLAMASESVTGIPYSSRSSRAWSSGEPECTTSRPRSSSGLVRSGSGGLGASSTASICAATSFVTSGRNVSPARIPWALAKPLYCAIFSKSAGSFVPAICESVSPGLIR